jgi:hypothetical protein
MQGKLERLRSQWPELLPTLREDEHGNIYSTIALDEQGNIYSIVALDGGFACVPYSQPTEEINKTVSGVQSSSGLTSESETTPDTADTRRP